MEVSQIVFVFLAALMLSAAVAVVTTRNLFHAALYLIISFFSVSGFYVLLEAGFFAAAQLLVYIGAISILFIFAVMLTRGTNLNERSNSQASIVGIITAVIFALLALFLWPTAISIPETRLGAFRILKGGIYGGEPWKFAPNTPDVARAVEDATLRFGISLARLPGIVQEQQRVMHHRAIARPILDG